MEKIGLSKQLDILKRYFSGSSYDEIALQSGVAKGTVANVVKDLKAGQIEVDPVLRTAQGPG